MISWLPWCCWSCTELFLPAFIKMCNRNAHLLLSASVDQLKTPQNFLAARYGGTLHPQKLRCRWTAKGTNQKVPELPKPSSSTRIIRYSHPLQTVIGRERSQGSMFLRTKFFLQKITSQFKKNLKFCTWIQYWTWKYNTWLFVVVNCALILEHCTQGEGSLLCCFTWCFYHFSLFKVLRGSFSKSESSVNQV